ncbi:unnamed protein product [Echinostoma caproni]|uniref:Uncharacterized protein n=1 Tax=Echinostoma caproni TaxID=27848 RepID=A0A3P8HG62_9TREM|nr:unnamed protein product [Echinostoma caproni]
MKVVHTESDPNEDAQTDSSPPNIRAAAENNDLTNAITFVTASAHPDQSSYPNPDVNVAETGNTTATISLRWITPQAYNPLLVTAVDEDTQPHSKSGVAEQDQSATHVL